MLDVFSAEDVEEGALIHSRLELHVSNHEGRVNVASLEDYLPKIRKDLEYAKHFSNVNLIKESAQEVCKLYCIDDIVIE